MCLFYLLIFLTMMLGLKFNTKGFHADYIDKPQCNAIKGIFILVVFLRHIFYPYLHEAGGAFNATCDRLFLLIDKQVGQLLVVMFLFYSGYGVMESIRKKGNAYVDSFPKRRILTTLLNFDVAVLAFVVMDLLLGLPLSLPQVGLSLIGWESVNNSNWYIFVILLCYAITYVCFRFMKKGQAWMVMVGTIMTMVILFFVKPSWWYNTILCYPAGMFFSIYKQNWECMARKRYLVMLLACLALFLAFHLLKIPRFYGLTYNVKSVVFALMVVLMTMKCSVRNQILCWLGVNLFPLYIYQRLPMLAIQQIAGDGWLAANPYLYVIICFFITCAVAWGYKYIKLSVN